MKLDPLKDTLTYTYVTESWPLQYTLKDDADGDAVLDFTLQDGNCAEFVWVSSDTAKGRFWLKGATKADKPATQVTMKR